MLLLFISLVIVALTIIIAYKYGFFERVSKYYEVTILLLVYLVYLSFVYILFSEVPWRAGVADLATNIVANILFLLLTIFIVDSILEKKKEQTMKKTKELIRKELDNLAMSLIGLICGALGRNVMDYNPQKFEEAVNQIDILLKDTKDNLLTDLQKLKYKEIIYLNEQVDSLKKDVIEIFVIISDNWDPLMKAQLILINRDLKQLINIGGLFQLVEQKYKNTPYEDKMFTKAREDFLPKYAEILKEFFEDLKQFRDLLSQTRGDVN